MSIRHLDRLFTPNSIALIGDTADAYSGAGSRLIRNLIDAGFQGQILPISPEVSAVEGLETYPAIEKLPLVPDLAVIASSARHIPDVVDRMARVGIPAAVLVDRGDDAPSMSERTRVRSLIQSHARNHDMRFVGPGGLGLAVPHHGLNVSLAHVPLFRGNVAFVTQSSGIFRSAIEWASEQGIGFSHLVSLGDAVDVDFADALDYLALDHEAHAILLHLEFVGDPRRFVSAARRAARMKPVVALKPKLRGAHWSTDAVYDAAFRRAGLLRVRDLPDLFNSVETLSLARPSAKNRLAIVSNSRSLALLAMESLDERAVSFARFSETTRAALDSRGLGANPVDLGDYATKDDYRQILELLLGDGEVDALVVIVGPGALGSNPGIAEVLVSLKQNKPGKILMSCWPGPLTGAQARKRLRDAGVPAYGNPAEAVQEFIELVQYHQNQALLTETPASIPEAFSPDSEPARAIVQRALAEGSGRLDECESVRLLSAYHIPVVETQRADSPAQAAEVASKLGWPVALKLMSPDLATKSAVAGVALGLDRRETVALEAANMIGRLHQLKPDARIAGFAIQPIVARQGAFELRAGFEPGGEFGPVMYFGHGGTESGVIDDVAYGLPPLNLHLARELMSRTRIFGCLDGQALRHADMDALALLLVKLSQMVVDLDEVLRLDINPIWAGAEHLVILDARAEIGPRSRRIHRRLAIQPYPAELEETITLEDGESFLLRPIRPEDEPELKALIHRCDPELVRMRFFQPMRELSHELAARLTQLDYDREMALALTNQASRASRPSMRWCGWRWIQTRKAPSTQSSSKARLAGVVSGNA